jgi:hypothetical protein
MEPVARQLWGEPNPGHSTARELRWGSHGSRSVNLEAGVWYDHEAGEGGGVLDLIRREVGLTGPEAMDWLRALDGQPLPPPRPSPRPTRPRDDAANTAAALRLWAEAEDPVGTPVETYLRRRGVELPSEAGEVLRWHRRCPFGKGLHSGCMVALVRNILTDEPQAIHRTALTLDGRKVEVGGHDRRLLGRPKGGAIKLTADADVTLSLGVGEGIETTLSLRRLSGCQNLSLWAVLNAGGLAAFPVLAGLEGLWVAVDNDPAGRAATETLKARWVAAGRDVMTARLPAEGADLNDSLKGRF